MAEDTGKVKISVWVEEKIGLPDFSNVVVGSSVSRYVDDGTEEEILDHIRETAHGTVEAFLAEEREGILEMVKKK